MKKLTIKNWQLQYDGKTIPAQVPGDLTIDLYNAGIVKNPYFGDNQKENDWIPRRDFTYLTEIVADEALLKEESIELVFNGIDVYSVVTMNDIIEAIEQGVIEGKEYLPAMYEYRSVYGA